MKEKTLLNAQYDGESLCDVERDVYEALQNAEGIPLKNLFGIPSGVYTVTVTWTPEDAE